MKNSLTWHNLMLLKRFTDLLTKPLVASLPLNVTDNELQILSERGVNGVVFEVSNHEQITGLKRVRQIIRNLTPSIRKSKKLEALLPYSGGAKETTINTDDEEDEEE